MEARSFIHSQNLFTDLDTVLHSVMLERKCSSCEVYFLAIYTSGDEALFIRLDYFISIK